MSIDVMKQALEALEDVQESYGNTSEWFQVRVAALRAAIEQAQEPVAWVSESENLLSWDKFYDHMTPLYTAPRQWQGLTRQEFLAVTQGLEDLEDCWMAIEAKLKEKNT